MNVTTCKIPSDDPLFQQYHDVEWGRPVADDTVFFEKVSLEGFQSGLSWKTILHRREALRDAFDHFHIAKVASYTNADVERLLGNAALIRNRRKIESVIHNARLALQLQQEVGSLAGFFWQFEPAPASRPATVTQRWLDEHPARPESVALAAALKKRGWSFVGPTTMYALMQALGMVNDHVEGCPCRAEVEQLRASFDRPIITHGAAST